MSKNNSNNSNNSNNDLSIDQFHCEQLAIDVRCPLSPDTAAAVASYHLQAFALDGEIELVQKERQDLLNNGGTMPLEQGAEQENLKFELEGRKGDMLTQRHRLRKSLVGDYKAHAEAEKAAHDTVLAAVKSELVSSGACDGIPAETATTMLASPQRYLMPTEAVITNTARRDMRVLIAAGRMNRGKQSLEELQASLRHPPSERDCKITWPTANSSQRIVAQLLAEHCPGSDVDNPLSAGAMTIRKELGLNGAILSEISCNVLEQIATATGRDTPVHSHIHLSPVDNLLEMLPKTDAVASAIRSIRGKRNSVFDHDLKKRLQIPIEYQPPVPAGLNGFDSDAFDSEIAE